MKNDIYINELLKSIKSEDNKVERVLWISESNLFCYTIDIYSSKAMPMLKKVEDLMLELKNEELVKLPYDPWVRDVKEENISIAEKKIRDSAWEIIRCLIDIEHQPEIYYSKKRRRLIKEVVEKYGVSEKTVYKYLKRYWQRGMTKNSLLPDYNECGAQGKERLAKSKKRGRPNQFASISDENIGINIDEDMKKIFRLSIKEFYENDEEASIQKMYELMISEYFTKSIKVNGKMQNEVIEAENIPSLGQFKYWFNKFRDIENETKKRKGEKRFNLDYRPILSSTESETLGPGSRFHIDATIADVYLVSRFNREWIIGRPVVYAILDVFSRMVTGIYVGLEGPSWLGAMMAVANMTENKAVFCEQYGISYDESKWPCKELPMALLADRGEFEGKMPSGLINYLNVSLENTAPYRGDLKGIVEQYFRTTNIKIKHRCPGFIKKQIRERGGKDYRLDAKLDIYQFTKIMIEAAIHHNNYKWLDRYNLDEYMIRDDINPIPIELWNWGIQNRSGKLKRISQDIVKLNIMPRGNASILRAGIKFNKMYYSCELALREKWFTEAEIKGSWTIEVCYDPRNANYIYIPLEDGNSFEKCYLLEKNEVYKDKSIEEVEDLIYIQKFKKEMNTRDDLQGKVSLAEKINDIFSEAEEMNKGKSNTQSNRKKIENISLNKASEKESLREEEKWEIGIKKDITDNQVIELSRNSAENTNASEDEDLAILKKIRGEIKK